MSSLNAEEATCPKKACGKCSELCAAAAAIWPPNTVDTTEKRKGNGCRIASVVAVIALAAFLVYCISYVYIKIQLRDTSPPVAVTYEQTKVFDYPMMVLCPTASKTVASTVKFDFASSSCTYSDDAQTPPTDARFKGKTCGSPVELTHNWGDMDNYAKTCMVINPDVKLPAKQGASYAEAFIRTIKLDARYTGTPGGDAPYFALLMIDTTVAKLLAATAFDDFTYNDYIIHGEGDTYTKFKSTTTVKLDKSTTNSFELTSFEHVKYNKESNKLSLSIYPDTAGPLYFTETDPVDVQAFVGLFGGSFAIFWTLYKLAVGIYYPNEDEKPRGYVRCFGKPV